jgi:hypothetical protein
MNENVETTKEVIKAFHLTGDTEYEIEPNTLAIAHKIGETWWLQVGETEYVPTIDFMVDNFDRNDADTLGSLWTNPTKWGIRSQKAYESGNGALYTYILARQRTAAKVHNISTSFFLPTYIDPSPIGTERYLGQICAYPSGYYGVVDVLYNGTFSNADHNIKIICNASSRGEYAGLENTGKGCYFEIATHIAPYFRDRGSRISITNIYHDGVATPGDSATVQGNYTCEHGGYADVYESMPASSFAAEQFALIRIAPNDGSTYRVIQDWGDWPQVNTSSPDDQIEKCSAGVHTTAVNLNVQYQSDHNQNGGPITMQSGHNIYYIEIRSGKASMWVNGSSLFLNEDLYTVTEGMFGFRGLKSALNRYLDGYENNYINQVKVWTADLPEPPDGESGHGTWTSEGGFVYTDKYHAGGTYNPNA